jgi:hypothetical protein
MTSGLGTNFLNFKDSTNLVNLTSSSGTISLTGTNTSGTVLQLGGTLNVLSTSTNSITTLGGIASKTIFSTSCTIGLGGVIILSTGIDSLITAGSVQVLGTNGFGGTIYCRSLQMSGGTISNPNGTFNGSMINASTVSTNNINVFGTASMDTIINNISNVSTITVNSSSSGTISILAHPTPMLYLTANTNTTINGIASAGVATGTIFNLIREGVTTSLTINHNQGVGTTNIILPSTRTFITINDRSGFVFVFTGSFWVLLSYTS